MRRLLILALGLSPIAQAADLARLELAPGCALRLQRDHDDADAVCWRIDCRDSRRALGCDLSAMRRWSDWALSPDRRWLAVVSVGEGHPILELVDVDALRNGRGYRADYSLNPFPGRLWLAGWRDGRLQLVSDMPLAEWPLDPDTAVERMPTQEQWFALDPLHPEAGLVAIATPAADPGD